MDDPLRITLDDDFVADRLIPFDASRCSDIASASDPDRIVDERTVPGGVLPGYV
jgi:hypothetical protein